VALLKSPTACWTFSHFCKKKILTDGKERQQGDPLLSHDNYYLTAKYIFKTLQKISY